MADSECRGLGRKKVSKEERRSVKNKTVLTSKRIKEFVVELTRIGDGLEMWIQVTPNSMLQCSSFMKFL